MNIVAIFLANYSLGNSPSILNLVNFFSERYEIHLFIKNVALSKCPLLNSSNVIITDLGNIDVYNRTKSKLVNTNYQTAIAIDPHGFVLCIDLLPEIRPYYYSLELYLEHDHFGLDYPTEIKNRERSKINNISGLIIQSVEKELLFRSDYNLQSDIPTFILPVTYQGKSFPVCDKTYLANKYSIAPSRKIALHLGSIASWHSCIEFAQEFAELNDWILFFQGYPSPEYKKQLLEMLKSSSISNVIISEELFDDIREIDKIIQACDVGIAWYNNISAGFRAAGLSSGKIPAYLRGGLPVLAKKYPSTILAIEYEKCGICVEDISAIPSALDEIVTNYDFFSANASDTYNRLYNFDNYKKRLLVFMNLHEKCLLDVRMQPYSQTNVDGLLPSRTEFHVALNCETQDSSKTPEQTQPEVNKWELSQFVADHLVKIVGNRPFPIDELLLMVSALSYFRPDIIIEWGTHVGKSARIFYETTQRLGINAEIHTIDLPPDDNHNENIKDVTQRAAFIKGLPVSCHSGDGLTVATSLLASGNYRLPLIFVDGDHSYDTVKNELQVIFEITSQAVILAHDTFIQAKSAGYNCGPGKAVEEFCKRHKLRSWSTSMGLPGMSLIHIDQAKTDGSSEKSTKASWKPLNILHTVEFYAPHIGGAETVVQQLSERLAQRGHHVTVATTYHAERNVSQLNGVHIKEFDVTGNLVGGLKGRDTQTYLDFLNTTHYDVVMNYAAQQWATDIALLHVAQSKHPDTIYAIAPCGYSALDDNLIPRSAAYNQYFSSFIPYTIPRYEAAIYHSSHYRDYEYAQRHGFSNSHVIPNGVGEDEFESPVIRNFRAEYGINTRYMGLCVANYLPGKGHERLIDCVRQMNRNDFTLVCIGNQGNLMPQLQRNSDNLPIRFLSSVPREMTIAAYQSADIFLFGSEIEASPLVIIEAKASRTPFVSTDCGNVREWCGGIVCTPDEMALNANRILDDDKLSQQLAEEGWHEWKTKLTWKAIVDQYEKLYLDLAEAKHAIVKSQLMLSIIFSKDRPLQLDATLRSFILHCLDFDRVSIRIIVTASNESFGKAYQILEQEYATFSNILFISENDFRQQVLGLLKSEEYLLWLVDDNIFIRNFELSSCCRLLDLHQDALGYSLRLGENTKYCYSLDKSQELPIFIKITPDTLKYDWTSAKYDFGYPLEVSSSLYRTADMLQLLTSLQFHNPNSLEAEMANQVSRFQKSHPYLLSSKHSLTFCNPINKVQNTAAANRAGESTELAAESLLACYQRGQRIDVAAFNEFTPNACHQEVTFNFTKKGVPSPKVSVVIPCYKQAHFLKEVVESVVGQTFTDWECLIVNDGSPDNTSEVARKLIERFSDKRIKLLEKPNGGLSDARNYGIARALGKYILPLDSDDMIHPDMLAKTVHFLDNNPSIAIVYTDLLHFGAVEKHVVAGEYDFEALRYGNQLNCCSLYRREAWEAVGGYNTNMTWGYEDWDFWIGCGQCGYFARHLPETLLFYRVKDESMYTKALEHDAELKARIVMNHPSLYSEEERSRAHNLLGFTRNASAIPMVSVIVPTYNRRSMLPDTIRTILDQTFHDFEIIVVNDAGEDVADIVNELKQLGKIRYINHETNKGLAAARNTGINAARGKYVALLDDDDVFYPDHLEIAIRELSESQKVIYTDAVRATYQKKGNSYELVEKHIPYSMDFNRNKLLLGNISPVNCFVFAKDLALKTGLFDETLSTLEDWDFWIRLSALAPFKHISKATVQVNWRTDGTTMTSSRQSEFRKNREAIYNKNRAAINKIPNTNEIMAEFQAIWSKDAMESAQYSPVKIESIKGLVSIVILTFNELKYTRECVESIKKQTPEPHEIIFIDNASTDGTLKWLKNISQENPSYKLIENKKNLGFANGCNQGIEASSGEYILLLNNDVVVTENWLSGMLECLNSAPDTGIVGPMTNNISGPQKVQDVDYNTIPRMIEYARSFRERYRHRRVSCRRIVGFCMLLRHTLVNKIGLLDETFGTGNFEDDDYCLRATLAGCRNLIAGDVFIHHYGSRSFIGNKIDYGSSISGNIQIFDEKWMGVDVNTPLGKKFTALNFIEKADMLNQKGQLDKSIAMFIEGIKYAPEEKAVYYRLAEMLLDAKLYKDALEAIQSMPQGSEDDLKRLEIISYCTEVIDEAEKLADRILAVDKDYAPAINLKGINAYKHGENNTAEEYFKKAIASDPGYGEPYTNLGVIKWAADKQEGALEWLEKGFILSPTITDNVTLYHTAVTALEVFERAEKLFQDAKKLHPENKMILFFLIDIFIKQGKYDAAMSEIEQAMLDIGIDDGMLEAALTIRKKVGIKEIDKDAKNKGTLSLCMIVKNEEQHLARCLLSVTPVTGEMILVDTGSTDRTKAIARAFGAKVFDFTWTNDFSEARNVSLSKATSDWILVLDADEMISALDYPAIEKIVKKKSAKPAAYSLNTRNYTNEVNSKGWIANDRKYLREEAGTGWFPSAKVRLFANDKRIQFQNPVHEFVEGTLEAAGIEIKASDIPVHHYGRFDKDKILAKGREYFLLGKKKIDQMKDDIKALKELAIQASELGEYDTAVGLWKRAIELSPNDAIAFLNISYAYMKLEKYEEALASSRRAVELDPTMKEGALNYAGSELIIGDIKKTISILEKLLRKEPDYPPAMVLAGAAYYVDGQKEKSLDIFEKLRKKRFDCTEFFDEQIRALMSQGRFPQAFSLLEAAVKTESVNKDTKTLLAECHGKIVSRGKAEGRRLKKKMNIQYPIP